MPANPRNDSASPNPPSAAQDTQHAAKTEATSASVASRSPHAERTPIRITFARGRDHAEMHDSLHGMRDNAYFIFDARKGQHALIRVNGEGATAGIIRFANGSQEGGPGGVIFDGILPASGEDSIRVFEHQMANEWKGTILLQVTIR